MDVRHLLLGALLPDATRFTIILVDVLDWPALATFTYFIPFHSLLIMGLLAGAMALLVVAEGATSRRAFAFIMGGVIFHLLLDDLEGSIGCGSTTFYPYYFGKPFNAWDSEGNVALLLLVISAVALGVALSRQRKWPRLTFRLSRWRLLGAIILVFAAIIIPLLFRQQMIDRNAYYLDFVTNPAAFEGRVVELCFSEVIATVPPTIEEFDVPFVLQTPATFTQGEWLSVRGVFQNGSIRPALLVRHRAFSDVGLSLVAAVLFAFLMFDWKIFDVQ